MQEVIHVDHFYRLKNNISSLETKPQLLLILLLTGHTRFSLDGVKFYKQYENYAVIPTISSPINDFVVPIQTLSASKTLDLLCISYGLDINHRHLVNRLNFKNIAFYSDLLLEFTHYFYMTNKGSHSSAFIFLYRIFERFAYAIQLLYTKLADQYFGTFNDLKNLLTGGADKELTLFKKLITTTNFLEVYTTSTSFGISFANTSKSTKFFKIIEKHCPSNIESKNPIDKTVSFKLEEMPNVLVNIRNRFFHYKFGEGQSNITIKDIANTDDFFKVFNKAICSYLSVITLNICYKDIK